jgi:hypothetical protein
MDGRDRGRQPRHHYPYQNRQRKGAIERAFNGAKLWLDLPVKRPASQCEAATAVGSTVSYVVAAAILLQSENRDLIDRVFAGQVPLLAAAASVRERAELVRVSAELPPKTAQLLAQR